MKVFDFCYRFVPVDAQKEFRRLMYEWDNCSVAFMDSFYKINILRRKRSEAIELSGGENDV